MVKVSLDYIVHGTNLTEITPAVRDELFCKICINPNWGISNLDTTYMPQQLRYTALPMIGWQPLHILVLLWDIYPIDDLIDEWVTLHPESINGVMSIDFTPLMTMLCFSKNINAERVARLIRLGADPNYHGQYGNTALHFAYMRGNVEIAEMLWAAGATRLHECSTLVDAIIHGVPINRQFEVLECIRTRNKVSSSMIGMLILGVFGMICRHREDQIILFKTLINNYVCDEYISSIRICMSAHISDVDAQTLEYLYVELFRTRRADNASRRATLAMLIRHYCNKRFDHCIHQDYSVLKMIIDDIDDSKYYTDVCMLELIAEKDNTELMKIMLDNFTFIRYSAVMKKAVSCGCLDMVRLLIGSGFDPKSVDEDNGKNYLHLAVKYSFHDEVPRDHVGIVRELVLSGCSFDHPDYNNHYPVDLIFHYLPYPGRPTSRRINMDLLLYMIDSGVNIRRSAERLLYMAHGHLDKPDVLIAIGAIVDALLNERKLEING